MIMKDSLGAWLISTVEESMRTGVWPTLSEFRERGLNCYSNLFSEGISVREEISRMSENTAAMFLYRHVFGFSIPCREALWSICSLGPILEIGAGSGLWSASLSKLGADIVATDVYDDWSFETGKFHSVERMDSEEAALAHPERTILASWPDYESDWLTRALRTRSSGARAVYIGEYNGCTGDDSLRLELLENWKEIEEIAIPQFPGMRDYLWIYERK